MRSSMRRSGGAAELRSAMSVWIAAAQRNASTVLANSTSMPSPVVLTTRHHAYSSEVHRTLGEILLRREPPDIPRVERAFTHALEIARRQQLKTFELRAALPLARLY